MVALKSARSVRGARAWDTLTCDMSRIRSPRLRLAIAGILARRTIRCETDTDSVLNEFLSGATMMNRLEVEEVRKEGSACRLGGGQQWRTAIYEGETRAPQTQ